MGFDQGQQMQFNTLNMKLSSRATQKSPSQPMNSTSRIPAPLELPDQLSNMQEYDEINVKVKVLDNNSPKVVGAAKQEIVIADKTATATLTVWEKDIDSLAISQCYSMKRLLVRVFTTLSLPDSGTVIQPIDEIHEVSDVLGPTINSNLENAIIACLKST